MLIMAKQRNVVKNIAARSRTGFPLSHQVTLGLFGLAPHTRHRARYARPAERSATAGSPGCRSPLLEVRRELDTWSSNTSTLAATGCTEMVERYLMSFAFRT